MAYKTLLWGAVAGGHHWVVQLLLEHEDVNPNIPDYCGRTLLGLAAEKGNDEVVKRLLK